MSRKTDILKAGLEIWSTGEVPTASAIARKLDMAAAHVSYYFNSSYRLREALVYYAIEQGESKVIVQLIGSGHAAVKNMPETERMQHLLACG